MKNIKGMKIELEIQPEQRAAVENKLSATLGEYIMSVEKTDFATWTPEEWGDMIAVAYDIVALETFKQRVILLPPFIEETAPPY